MAIFWDYIKGTTGDGSSVTTINFEENARPTIKVGTTEYGSVITTEGGPQTILSETLTLRNLTTRSKLTAMGETTVTGSLIVTGRTFLKTITVQDNTAITMGNITNGSTSYNDLRCNSLTANELKTGNTIINTNGITTGTLTVSSITFS